MRHSAPSRRIPEYIIPKARTEAARGRVILPLVVSRGQSTNRIGALALPYGGSVVDLLELAGGQRTMGYDAQLLLLIEYIYEAAANAAAFPALANAIARHFNTESTFLYLCGDTAGHDVDFILAATPNFDKWARSSYNEYYHQRDEWFTHT